MELFKKFLLSTFFITSFFMTVLFVCSNEIILILIGAKWTNSILYLKILSISGLFMPLYALNINFLAVKKRTRLYFKIELFSKLLAIPIVFIGILFGIIPLLIGIAIVSVSSYFTSAYFINRFYNYSFNEQFSLVFKGVLLFLIALILTLSTDFFEIESLFLKLFFNLILICGVFLIGMQFLFSDLVSELKTLFKKN